MKHINRWLMALAIALFSGAAVAQDSPDMLTIITSDDDETQAMALILDHAGSAQRRHSADSPV